MKIYELFLSENFQWNNREKKLLQFVSNERQKTISSYRFIPDQLRSLYGALLVKMGIYYHSGIPPGTQKFEHLFMIKPRLLNSGVNAAFSLSHSGTCVVCGISDFQIGVDTEQIILPFPKEILSCFSPDERAECESGTEMEQADAFYRIWTRKEAYGKWNGMGLNQAFSAIDIYKEGYQTWSDHSHMISVYSDSNETAEIHRLTADDLADFYSGFISNT